METMTVIILFIGFVSLSFLVLIGFFIYFWIKRSNERSKLSERIAKGAGNKVDYKHNCPTCGTKLQFLGASQMAWCPICNKHVKDKESDDMKKKIFFVQSTPVMDDMFMEENIDYRQESPVRHRTFENRPHESVYSVRQQQVQEELPFVPAQPLPPPPQIDEEMDSVPLSILKKRLARGEITPKEFRKLRSLLEK